MSPPSKLLVVEDDPDVRAALVEFLLLEGFEVAEAGHGLAALEQLQDGYRPDAILLDLSMPVMDGRALHRILHGSPTAPNLPRVGELAGVLPKPVDYETLLALVHRTCARRTG